MSTQTHPSAAQLSDRTKAFSAILKACLATLPLPPITLEIKDERRMVYKPCPDDLTAEERALLTRAGELVDAFAERYKAACNRYVEADAAYRSHPSESNHRKLTASMCEAYVAEIYLLDAKENRAALAKMLVEKYARYEGQLLTAAQKARMENVSN